MRNPRWLFVGVAHVHIDSMSDPCRRCRACPGLLLEEEGEAVAVHHPHVTVQAGSRRTSFPAESARAAEHDLAFLDCTVCCPQMPDAASIDWTSSLGNSVGYGTDNAVRSNRSSPVGMAENSSHVEVKSVATRRDCHINIKWTSP